MNANLKNSETPVLAVGQIDGETFQAELFPQAQIVLCYSPSPDNILSIVDTERQAKPIAVRLQLHPEGVRRPGENPAMPERTGRA